MTNFWIFGNLTYRNFSQFFLASALPHGSARALQRASWWLATYFLTRPTPKALWNNGLQGEERKDVRLRIVSDVTWPFTRPIVP